MSSSGSIKRPDSTGLPTSQPMIKLEHSFHEPQFNEAENKQLSCENDMKMEISFLSRDRVSVKEEVCLLEREMDLKELEKLNLEEKLQDNERKCEELKERVARLLEEIQVSNNREKRAEECCNKILEENLNNTKEKNNLILELKEKVNKLKHINLENEFGYMEKYKCFDMKIVKKDQEIEDLKHERSAAAKMIEELKRKNTEANKIIDELRLKKSESDKSSKLKKIELGNLGPKLKKMVEDLASSGEETNLKSPVFKGKNGCSGKDNTPNDAEDVPVLPTSNSSGLSKKGDRKSVQTRIKEDGDHAHNKVTSRGSQSGYIPSQPESNKHKETMVSGHFIKIPDSSSGDIIEILDSDDEANRDGEADISNVDEKNINFVQSPTCSQRIKRNQTTKRKRNMCTSEEDIILINEKENRMDSSSRKCVKKAGPASDSQTPLEKLNGLNNEITRGPRCGSGRGSSKGLSGDLGSSSLSKCHLNDTPLNLGLSTPPETFPAAPSAVGTLGGESPAGDRKSVQPRTKEDDDAHNIVNTSRGSQCSRNPSQPESNTHKEPMVSVRHHLHYHEDEDKDIVGLVDTLGSVPASATHHDDDCAADDQDDDDELDIPLPDGPQVEIFFRGPILRCRGCNLSTLLRTIFERNFHPAGWNWKNVPDNVRDSYWERFQERCFWDRERYDDDMVRRKWTKSIGSAYGKRLYEYRQYVAEKGELHPCCYDSSIWRAWSTEWEKPENKSKSEQCSKNKMSQPDGPDSGISKHTGGSRSAIDHADDMSRTLGRSVSLYEVFVKTHKNKDGLFVDKKSRQMNNEYMRRLNAAIASARSRLDDVDADAIWLALVGTDKKRTYGVGSLGKVVSKGSSCFSSSEVMEEELRQLREELEEQKRVQEAMRAEFEAHR